MVCVADTQWPGRCHYERLSSATDHIIAFVKGPVTFWYNIFYITAQNTYNYKKEGRNTTTNRPKKPSQGKTTKTAGAATKDRPSNV